MTTDTNRIVLLVQLNSPKREQMIVALEAAGFCVNTADTLFGIWHTMMEEPPFAVVIDTAPRGVPWHPWELCRELADTFSVLIILLIHGHSSGDRSRAFTIGADQCFSISAPYRDIVAYLEAQSTRHRRANLQVSSSDKREENVLEIDWYRRQATRGNRVIDFSRKEFMLLELLARQEDQIVTPSEIFKTLWKSELPVDHTQLVKQYILRLRQKIEIDPHNPQHLLTYRGMGYSFRSAQAKERDAQPATENKTKHDPQPA